MRMPSHTRQPFSSDEERHIMVRVRIITTFMPPTWLGGALVHSPDVISTLEYITIIYETLSRHPDERE
jgi:hypothetical protein